MQKGIKWGYCIPSTCSPQDLEDGLRDYIKPPADVHVYVFGNDCYYDKQFPYSIMDWFTLSLLIILLMLVLLSSGYEMCSDEFRKIRERKPLAQTGQNGTAGNEINNVPEIIELRPSCQNSSSFSTLLSFDKRYPKQLPFKDKYTLTYLSNLALTNRSTDRSENGSEQHLRQKISPDDISMQSNSRIPGTGTSNIVQNNCESEQRLTQKISPDDTSMQSNSRIPGTSTSNIVQNNRESEQRLIQKISPVVPNGGILLNKNPGNSRLADSAVTTVNVYPVITGNRKISPDSEVSSINTDSEFSRITSSKTEQNIQYINIPTGFSFWSMDEIPVEDDPQDVPRLHSASPISMDDDFLDPSYKNLSWLSSFSIFSNGRHVFYLDNRKSTLHSIYGLKFLSALWVLIGDTVMIMDILPSLNYLSYKHNYRQWYYMLLEHSNLGIDTFFVITGVMISYTFLRDMRRLGIRYKKDSPTGMTWRFFISYLPLHYIQRYMRLTPVLALLVLVQLSLYSHFGSGPLWYTNNKLMENSCRKYWWSTLTYLENYVNGNNMCLPHMWYLMVDMQLYLFSPLILLAFLIWPKRINLAFTSSLFLTAIIISYCVNYILQLPVGFWNSNVIKFSMKIQHQVIVTHGRFGPWIVGLFIGYLLYHTKKSQTRLDGDKMEEYPRWLWLLSAMGIFYSVFGAITFYTPNSDNTVVNAAVYNCLYRNVWAMCIGWIIFACETNNGGFVQFILTLKVFQPLYRLAYCTYLIHIPLLVAKALVTRTPIEKSDIWTISSVCADVVLSNLLAVILVLFVELPFVRLFEVFSYPWKYCIEMMAAAGQRNLQGVEESNSFLQDTREISERTPLLTSSNLNGQASNV